MTYEQQQIIIQCLQEKHSSACEAMRKIVARESCHYTEDYEYFESRASYFKGLIDEMDKLETE